MSEERCPNCRGVRQAVHAATLPCPMCGWLPLQSTEMLFLDGPATSCPQCARERPASDATCPHCGYASLLAPPLQRVSTFRISTLLVVMAVVAFCLLLTRISIVLGLVVSIVSGLAGLRTTALVRERKRMRYPDSARDTMRAFTISVTGIIAAAAVFVLTLLLVQLLAMIGYSGGPGFLINGVSLLSAVSLGIALRVAWHEQPHRLLLVAGFLWTFSSSISSVAITSGIIEPLASYCGLILLTTTGATIAVGWRRGQAPAARSFIVGAVLGCTLTGLIVGSALYVPCLAANLLLWPALSAQLTLEKMWSWDDALPLAIASNLALPNSYSPCRRLTNSAAPESLPPPLSNPDDAPLVISSSSPTSPTGAE